MFNIKYFKEVVMDKKKLLGSRIRELRQRKRITQEQLSELISVDPATVSKIENGKNYPTMNNLENIVDVLECSFTDVFDFEHKETTSNLIEKINIIMINNPEQIEVLYKIISALTK